MQQNTTGAHQLFFLSEMLIPLIERILLLLVTFRPRMDNASVTSNSINSSVHLEISLA